jgi:DNA-binding LytR/AlgR family response regulator
MKNSKPFEHHSLAYYPASEITKIGFPTASGIELFFIHEILFLEGKSNYTSIMTVNGEILVSKTLAEMHSKLPKPFVRIHKSFVINVNLSISVNLKQRQVKLINGISVPISIRLKKNLQELIIG